jgi:hypothetical protein
MKKFNIISLLFIFLLFLCARILCEQAEWSILVIIQADNNLASLVNYNIKDMIKGVFKDSSDVNILVQFDKPNSVKTWRYKINKGVAVEADSLNSEMGVNPAKELITAAKWVKTKYPAKHYGVILSNHGTGIEDYKGIISSKLWLEVPGIQEYFNERGILYDDSQSTCLTNKGLLTACAGMSQVFGKKIDLLGMDACLMAMLEIAYQIKDYAEILVASEQVEPVSGWNYSGFILPLTQTPTAVDNIMLAKKIVDSYDCFYKKHKSDLGYTLSAIKLDSIEKLKQNVDNVIRSIYACKQILPDETRKMVIKSRNVSKSFFIKSYIDIYSFYVALLDWLPKTKPKSELILDKVAHKKAKTNKEYQDALDCLKGFLAEGFAIIDDVVIANAADLSMKNANGVSIYYPPTNRRLSSIHLSYHKTQFAKSSLWLKFIREFRNNS